MNKVFWVGLLSQVLLCVSNTDISSRFPLCVQWQSPFPRSPAHWFPQGRSLSRSSYARAIVLQTNPCPEKPLISPLLKRGCIWKTSPPCDPFAMTEEPTSSLPSLFLSRLPPLQPQQPRHRDRGGWTQTHTLVLAAAQGPWGTELQDIWNRIWDLIPVLPPHNFK